MMKGKILTILPLLGLVVYYIVQAIAWRLGAPTWVYFAIAGGTAVVVLGGLCIMSLIGFISCVRQLRS